MQIYRAADIRQIDEQAERQGFSLFALMENTGRGLADHMQTLLQKEARIMIVCGRGNNGGDGIVLARYLLHAGFHVQLTFPLGLPKTATAQKHAAYYEEQGFKITEWKDIRACDVIIDGLLGIGTTLPLRDKVKDVITWCNEQSAMRIAIDIPTGVQADCGEVMESSVFLAHTTFSLHGAKPSAFLLPSSTFYGQVKVVSIGLKQESRISVVNKEVVQKTLPQRLAASHKGSFGTSLLLAGSDDMPGSALLAAIGAIRSGTGKLLVGTSKLAATVIAPVVPEATYVYNGLQHISEGNMPEKVAAAGIGPGITDEKLAQTALNQLLTYDIPIVVDAGALVKRENWHAKGTVILTPHPGEFSRLTGKSVPEIQANRIVLAQAYAEKHQLFLVLKGHDTVIACPDGAVFINPTGNSGLAKGGSGDVLTGMLVSMLATHEDPKDAIRNAIYIHGLCANKWAETYNEASMVASDLDDLLPVVLKELESTPSF